MQIQELYQQLEKEDKEEKTAEKIVRNKYKNLIKQVESFIEEMIAFKEEKLYNQGIYFTNNSELRTSQSYQYR